jgi:hypothetical protein
VLSGVPDLAFVHLTQRDVVRHRIVADIVAAYEHGSYKPARPDPVSPEDRGDGTDGLPGSPA